MSRFVVCGILCLCAICFFLSACGASEMPLYVDGEAVSEQELSLLDGDVDLAVRMKVLQKWAYEDGAAKELFSYEAMLTELEEENRNRKEKKESGEVVYGVTEYTPVQYYYEKMGTYERMLKDEIMKNATEEEQKAWYEAHLEEYRRMGEVRAVAKILQDGVVLSEEEFVLTSDNYRTLSEQNEELVVAVMSLSEGETRNFTDIYGQEWQVSCISKAEGTVLPFEEVSGAVLEQYANEKLETELNERIKRSKVKISEKREEDP